MEREWPKRGKCEGFVAWLTGGLREGIMKWDG